MATDIRARIAALQTALPQTCKYYDLPFTSGNQRIRLLHLHPTRYEQGAPANPPTVPIQGPEGLERIPALSELFGALLISGLHGIETWAPEFLMDIAELLAAAIDDIQNGNAPAPFQVPASNPSYSLSSDEVKQVVEKLDLFFVPVVCPWGRIHSSRGNHRNVDLNRNFPFLWKRHHDSNDYYDATATVDANQPGTSAASEVETQAVVALLYALPVNLFVDCHSRMRGSATYPWACEGTQTTDKTRSDFQYDRADAATLKQADGVVGGSGYDEFLPSGTKANLASAGAAIANATDLTTPGVHLPGWQHGHSIAALPYIGVSDDFAMSLDICNMLAFTFEIVESNVANRPGAAGQYQSALMALLDWYAKKVVAVPPAPVIRRPIHRNIPMTAQGPQPPENWDD